jgi:hypothetical protein
MRDWGTRLISECSSGSYGENLVEPCIPTLVEFDGTAQIPKVPVFLHARSLLESKIIVVKPVGRDLS